jgi:hypothetical protein
MAVTEGSFAAAGCDSLQRVPVQRVGWLLVSGFANGYYWGAGFAWQNLTRFVCSDLSYMGEVPRIDGVA